MQAGAHSWHTALYGLSALDLCHVNDFLKMDGNILYVQVV